MKTRIDLLEMEIILEAETDFEKHILKYFNQDDFTRRIKMAGDSSGNTLRLAYSERYSK